MCGLVSRFQAVGIYHFGRYLDLAKRRCQSVWWVIGSWVHCQYLLYDAGMILRSHWRRVRFRLFSFTLDGDLYDT
jgi:hypothetical protein